MDKRNVLNKMEDALNAMRQQLAENNGSTLATVVNNIKMSIESIKTHLSGNEAIHNFARQCNEKLKEFNAAVEKGDRHLSARAVEGMQKILDELKTHLK